jgi:hypothetical protein
MRSVLRYRYVAITMSPGYINNLLVSDEVSLIWVPCSAHSKSLRALTLLGDVAEILSHRSFNLKAQMLNMKVSNATGALVVMRSIDQGPNHQVPINQPIPNFPGTLDAVSQMTGILSVPRFLFFRIAELTNVLRSAPMSRYPHSP